MKVPQFLGIIVYDHEEKRFWSKARIKELAIEFWEFLEMNTEPTEEDLAFLFRQEFDQYTDNQTHSRKLWDDCARWEMFEAPSYLGFGIWEKEDQAKIKGCIKEAKGVLA